MGEAVADASELLVVSDTHGDLSSLILIFRWAKKRGIGMLVFLGDGLSDIVPALEKAAYNPLLRAVRGNGDSDHAVPFSRTMEFRGRTFFLTHGHQNAVHDTLDSLVFSARSAHAELALFGHTHHPFHAAFRGIALVNPGSPARPRGSEPSFATILCAETGPCAVFHWRIDADGSIREYELKR